MQKTIAQTDSIYVGPSDTANDHSTNNNKIEKPAIGALYSYRFTNTENAMLKGITLQGVTNVTNGAAFAVPVGLKTATLAALGLKLQYTHTGGAADTNT